MSVLFLFVLFAVASAGSSCTVISDAVEAASLAAAGLSCVSSGVTCSNSSGPCTVTAVTVSLTVSNTNLTQFSLPSLTSWSGSFLFEAVFSNNAFLINISFSSLTTISGGGPIFVTNNSMLSTFSLPALTAISRPLTVSNNSALSSFSLPVLTNLESSLTVSDNAALISFLLPALTSMMFRSLTVSNNAALSSFSLPVLTSGFLTVSDNAALISLLLPAWTSGTLTVSNNAALSLLSVPALASASLSVSNNAALISLLLPALTSSSTLTVSSNAGLSSLSLPAFTSGTLTVSNNSALISLSLQAFTSGSFTVSSNAALGSFSLPAFTSGSVAVSSNPALSSFSLPSLTTGNMRVSDNGALLSLSLPALVSMGQLMLSNNSALLSLSLPSLVSYNGPAFTISSNNVLTSISLPALTFLQGGIDILNNPSLVHFEFPVLKAVPGFSVSSNAALTNFSFPLLSSIGTGYLRQFSAAQSLTIDFNSQLTVISLPHLVNVAGAVSIESNAVLTSLSLPNLTSVDGRFRIANPSFELLNCSSLQRANGIFVSKVSSAILPSLITGTGVETLCDPGYGANVSFLAKQAVVCSTCLEGFFSPTLSISPCSSCPSGQGSTKGADRCVQCGAGSYGLGGSPCVNCLAGQFSNAVGAASNLCQQCPPGTFSAVEGSSGCTPCPLGSISLTAGSTSNSTCQPCPAGTFAASGSICAPCPAGFISNTSALSCEPCAPGQIAVNRTACIDCMPGFFASSGLFCVPCAPGFVSNARATSCIPCAEGQIAINNTICQNCSAGSFATVGASRCFDCGPGTWSGSNSGICQLCPAGTFSAASGATSASSCQNCSAGSYALQSGSSSCTLCEPGTASVLVGASVYSCQDCLAGKFASVAGSPMCSDCPAGFISTSNKSVSCVPCPPGEYQPVAGMTSCLICPNGTTNKFSGKDACATCLPGTAPLTVASGCVECPRGFASPDGRSCNECKGQFFASRSGLSACEQCPIGQTAQSSWGPCVPCTQTGYYVDLVLGCQPCPNGTFLSSAGTCVSCSAGFWSGEASMSCYPCQKGFDRPGSSINGCRPCAAGFVAPIEGTPSCSQCARGLFVVNSSSPCHPCARGTFADVVGASSCAACPSNRLCPLATSVPVDSSRIPFFAGLVFSRFGISSGVTVPSFNANSLVSQNFWTTSSGIIALVVLCSLLVLIPCALAVIYFGCRCTSKSSAQFETWKASMANLDFLYASSHKNGSLPRVVIERKTVFGAMMSIVCVVACSVLLTFLVLNWFYSPTLSSSLVPFGYVGEPDPIAGLQLQLELWGWSGPCALPFGSACAMSFTADGIGQTNGSQLLFACTNRSFSCFIDISASAAVISSFGSLRMTSPQGGNPMGVTYTALVTPSLNSTASTNMDVSETIFAGSSEVFGGPDPVMVSLSTKWARLRDETKGTARNGWIVGSAGVSPGSTLNNVSFLDPARDKQFRLSISLARGTEFLAITISYSSSIAILIGSIIGYLLGVVVLVRFIMRCVEWVHQLHHDAPSAVTEYLASLAPPPAPTSFEQDGHKSMLAASDTLGRFETSFEKQMVPIGDDVELEAVPHATKISNYDAHRMSSL